MTIPPDNFETILSFWFEEAGSNAWFNGGDAFDAKVRSRYEDVVLEIAAHYRSHPAGGAGHAWERSAPGMLALIICLDQFPRNMYRGTKAAFAFDDIALILAQNAVRLGFDLQTPEQKRSFFYMPFMHAEDLAMQDECVRLVDMRLNSSNTLFHAKAHRKLIARFGRFPHRNAALGRTSTPEEIRFLKDGGYSP